VTYYYDRTAERLKENPNTCHGIWGKDRPRTSSKTRLACVTPLQRSSGDWPSRVLPRLGGWPGLFLSILSL